MHPCLFCSCTGGPDGTMKQANGWSADAKPFPSADQAVYDAACARCEQVVRVTSQGQLNRLVAHLEYDVRGSSRRTASTTGRGLARRDFAELGLVRGAQLEPTRTLRDVGLLDVMAAQHP